MHSLSESLCHDTISMCQQGLICIALGLEGYCIKTRCTGKGGHRGERPDLEKRGTGNKGAHSFWKRGKRGTFFFCLIKM